MKFQIGGDAVTDRPRIIVSLTDQEPLPATGMDVAELRIDAFGSREKGKLLQRIAAAAKAAPILATIRLRAELGQWEGTEEERLALFQSILPHVAAVDIEMQSEIAGAVVHAAREAGKSVIVSWHGRLENTDPEEMAERGAALGADAVKIAAFTDSLAELRLLASTLLKRPEMSLIAVGMGRFGALSRLLLPALGSPYAYAHPDGAQALAPGQLSLQQTLALLTTLYPPADAHTMD